MPSCEEQQWRAVEQPCDARRAGFHERDEPVRDGERHDLGQRVRERAVLPDDRGEREAADEEDEDELEGSYLTPGTPSNEPDDTDEEEVAEERAEDGRHAGVRCKAPAAQTPASRSNSRTS